MSCLSTGKGCLEQKVDFAVVYSCYDPP
jgi:hypothetical protein